MTSTPSINVSPLLKWIPTPIKNEIIIVCGALLVVAQLVAGFVVMNGAQAHDLTLITGGITALMTIIGRGLVTPTHRVAVDKRDTTSPVNVGTSGPVEPGIIPPELL